MNKRSATLIAASLVGVLAIAGAAFSLGITGPTASAASEQTSAVARKPIVRTHTKTVVVHRQAAAPAPDRRAGRPVNELLELDVELRR